MRSSQTGQTLRISENIAEEPAEAQLELILSDVAASGPVGWHVHTERSGQTVVDVQVLRGPGRPQSIDRLITSVMSTSVRRSIGPRCLCLPHGVAHAR